LELTAYLDKFLRNSSPGNILQSAKKSVKLVFSHNKIADFAFKLDRLRSTLILGSILAFKASANLSTEDVLTHLKRIEKENEEQGVNNAQLLESTQLLVDIHGETAPKLDAIQEQVQTCLKQLQSLRDHRSKTREREILQWLDFRQMSWRYEEIHPAHEKTCEWIFKGPYDDRTKTWDDFTDYLCKSEVSKPYFINGHPGSGKSTLMKYIVTNPRTEDALTMWADNGELLIVKFFFWNLGTDLQKTTLGMLRNIMHDILVRYPELIPIVFSGMYQSWADVGSTKDSQPTLIELKMAFKRLMQTTSKFLKLCIFIDGVDELVGDHKDIAEFLCSLVSPHIKLVLSSRPIAACVNAFHGSPSLRLHELTASDIALFINDTLVSHRSMVALRRQYPDETTKLVTEIKDKASGVFLWVRLVVRQLIDGVEAGDDLPDLQRKLNSLPGDLRKLYSRMMSGMNPEYKAQAAEIFQLLQTWKKYVPDQPLRTIVLSFAMQGPLKAFNQAIQPLDLDIYAWLCQNAEARINSRCCGLLDGYSSTIVSSSGKQPSSTGMSKTRNDRLVVDYFHRTISEFLALDEVWSEICKWLKNDKFDATLSLASALLASIKTAPQYPDLLMVDDINALSVLYRLAPSFSDVPLLVGHIEAMDSVITSIQDRSLTSRKVHWSMDLYPTTLVEGDHLLILQKRADIQHFAARSGIVQYLSAVHRTKGYGLPSWIALPALESWMNPQLRQTLPLLNRIEVMRFIVASISDQGMIFHLNSFCQVIRLLVTTESNLDQEADMDSSLAQVLFGAQSFNAPFPPKLSSVQYSLDCAALVATCLTTMNSPTTLFLRLCPNIGKEDGVPQSIEPDLDLESMASTLQKHRDSGISQLGHDMFQTLRSLKEHTDEKSDSSKGKRPWTEIVENLNSKFEASPSLSDTTFTTSYEWNVNQTPQLNPFFDNDTKNEQLLWTSTNLDAEALDVEFSLFPYRQPPFSDQIEAYSLPSKRRRRASDLDSPLSSLTKKAQKIEGDNLVESGWTDDVEVREGRSILGSEGFDAFIEI
jgi:hypothetical protein